MYPIDRRERPTDKIIYYHYIAQNKTQQRQS